jgi:hypothetical protein
LLNFRVFQHNLRRTAIDRRQTNGFRRADEQPSTNRQIRASGWARLPASMMFLAFGKVGMSVPVV